MQNPFLSNSHTQTQSWHSDAMFFVHSVSGLQIRWGIQKPISVNLKADAAVKLSAVGLTKIDDK